MRGWSGECLFVCSGNAKTQRPSKVDTQNDKKLRSACASYQPRVSTATHLSSTLSLVIRKSRVTRAYEEALDLSEGVQKVCKVLSKMWLIDEGSHGLEQSDQPLALLE